MTREGQDSNRINGTWTDPRSCKTAVVIPYYQEEPGILRRAVMSAIAQEGISELEIIVIDDGSPASARNDLTNIDLPAHVVLKLIEQPNRGPGAARNSGLACVSSETVYVALLDSDDCWTRKHLRNAHFVLESGYDVYFANLIYLESNDSSFSRIRLDPSKHICIDAERGYFRFVDNARYQAINSVNPFHTSSVVYRWQKFMTLRFHEMAFMGEDLTFWMELARETNQIAFCTDVECFSGRGIHIYENSGWGTPRAIWRAYQFMKWRKWLQKTILGTEHERKDNLREIKKLRRSFIAALLHEIRRLQAFTNPDVARFVVCDPKVVLYIIPVTIELIAKKVRLRRSEAE